MGTSWEDVEPKQYKYEPYEYFVHQCLTDEAALTFTVDAGAEGVNLVLDSAVDSLYSYWVMNTHYDPNLEKDRQTWLALNIVYAKIDWGDGTEEIVDVKKPHYDETDLGVSTRFTTEPLSDPQILPSHVYRTGGIKTVKIWGNVVRFGCKQIKDIIRWGSLRNDWAIESQALLEGLINQGVVLNGSEYFVHWTDGPLVGAKCEGFNNFKDIDITFQGENLNTNAEGQDSLLGLPYTETFSVTNSPNLYYPSLWNMDKLATFTISNCAKLRNIDLIAEKGTLTTFNLSNNPSLEGFYAGHVDMKAPPSIGNALELGKAFKGDTKLKVIQMRHLYAKNANFSDFKSLEEVNGWWHFDGGAYFRNCTNLNKIGYFYPTCNCIDFRNSGIYQINFDNFNLFEVGDYKPYFNASNCPRLWRVTGFITSYNYPTSTSFSGCFSGCKAIRELGPIFSRYYDKLPNINYMFSHCDLKTLPNDLFADTNESGVINIPVGLFMDNPNLTNYPILRGNPIWKQPHFFGGTITTTYAFLGCDLLKDVPTSWKGQLLEGGNYRSIGKDVAQSFTGLNIFTINGKDNLSITSREVTLPADTDIQVQVENTWTVPKGNLYVTNFGEAPASYTDSTKFIHLGPNKGAFKNVTSIKIPNAFEGYDPFLSTESIDKDFFVGWDSLTTLENWLKNNKVITILPDMYPLANTLQKSYHTFEGCPITNVDNIFKNCTKLEDASSSFYKCKSLTSAVSAFEGCTSLTEVTNCFAESKVSNITNIFKGCTALTNVRSAFTSCSELTNVRGIFADCPNLTNISGCFADTGVTDVSHFMENYPTSLEVSSAFS